MFKKFGEFYKIDNGGASKKEQNPNYAPPPTPEIDTVKIPFSASAYRDFVTKHKALSQKIQSREKSEKR